MSDVAVRVRRHRARQRAGKRCFLLELDEAGLEDMLSAAGLDVGDDPEQIRNALQQFLEMTISEVTGYGGQD